MEGKVSDPAVSETKGDVAGAAWDADVAGASQLVPLAVIQFR